MYHNKSFYLGYQSENNLFLPNVISAFKILVDENYFYFMDDEERNLYPKGTVAFIRQATAKSIQNTVNLN